MKNILNYPLGDFKEKLDEYLAGVPDEPKIELWTEQQFDVPSGQEGAE